MGSRARWVEDGEKNSKYFFNLEKRNKANNKISKLLNPNGDVVDDEKLIPDLPFKNELKLLGETIVLT